MTLTKIRPLLLGAIAALAVLGTAAGCGSEPEPIVIGLVSGLRREVEVTDNRLDAINGMQLFVAEFNKRSVNGRMIELIEVAFESNDEEAVLQALENVERIHKPLAYISFDTNLVDLTAAFAEEHKVVHLALFGTFNATTDREWVFEYRAPLESYFEEGRTLSADLGVKQLTFLYNRDSYFGALVPTITPEMIGVLSIALQSFGTEDTDYRTQITSAQGSDAIYLHSESPEQTADIVRQMRELNYQGYIVGPEVWKDPNNPDLSEFVGIYVIVPLIYRTDFLFAQDVRERYDIAYETTVFSFFNDVAAKGYDAVRLIAELLEDAEPTREHLKTMFQQGFGYDGLFGNITLLPGEHTIEIPLHRAKYVEGGLEYLE